MAIFKCKMCGGTLEVGTQSVATCEYCGTQQTLPKLDDERRANLYDRANHFRRNNEFDKAMGIYEQILNEDGSDAEAYWSLVLCRYGIEYVEDPATRRRIPTINRAQFTSVFDDDNYTSAIQHADTAQKCIYEAEAKAINEIQKGILAISQKEEPFDVFICYKETDRNGRRTPDSVLATELYHELKEEGFKVFFSRITLEDKLGTAYEPYIFAALHSAKVMVVLGTRAEHFNAVWVKNEWSRYLALIKGGAKKMLIPAYRDMDPYDLPEEFSHLQAQDMSKLGFMQDLTRGIKKIVGAKEAASAPKAVPAAPSAAPSTAPLLKRAFMFLEDGNFAEADEYCERVLDQNPECAEAYLGKLMAELKVRRREHLLGQGASFENNSNYQKAMRFGDDKLKETLKSDIAYILERNEKERLERIEAEKERKYQEAVSAMDDAETDADFTHAASLFSYVTGYKDATERKLQCTAKAKYWQQQEIYLAAKDMVGRVGANPSSFAYNSALNQLEQIPDFEDVQELIALYTKKRDEVRAQEEAEAKRNKKIGIILISVVLAAILVAILLVNVIIPGAKYNKAKKLYEQGAYDEAVEIFLELRGYKDSDERAVSSYAEAVEMAFAKDDYKTVVTLYEGIKDSSGKTTAAYEKSCYQLGAQFFADGDFISAVEYFEKTTYSNSRSQKHESMYQYVLKTLDAPDEITRQYLDVLKEISYKNSRDLFFSAFGWKIKSLTVSNKRTSTKNMEQIKAGEDVYVHFQLESGIHNNATAVTLVSTYPTGQQRTTHTSAEYTPGSTGTAVLYPSYTKGTLQIYLLDAEGFLIGSTSVQIV